VDIAGICCGSSGNLTNVGSTISTANAAAATTTAQVSAAASDQVSTQVAALFAGTAWNIKAISAQLTAFHRQFVQTLNAGAGAYASARQ